MNNNKKLVDYKKIVKILLVEIFLLIAYILGSSLNFLVVTKNSCRMPVRFSEFVFETNNHFSFSNNSEVNYWFLSDIFDIHFLIFSIGDLLIFVSIIGLIFTFFYLFKLRIKKRLK